MRKLTLSTLALLLVSCFLLASSFAQDYFFQGTLNEPAGVAEREPLTPEEAEFRRALAFDPAGRVLASGGLDKTVRLWNPHTGQLLGSLEHPATVLAVTFSPDGEMLASASEDNAIRLWDPHGRQLLGTLEGHGKPVYAVAFSPDGRHLASGSGDGTVRLWDAQSGELLKTFRGHNRGVLGVAFSETGLLASAGVDWTIQVYEVSTGRFLRTLTGHTAQVTSVAFTGAASGDIRLISGSRDGTVHSWNPDTGELLDSLWPYPDSAVNSVALLANADATVKIASARSDGTVRLGKLDMDSGLSADPVPLPIRLDTQYAIAVRGVAFSPGGMHLASVSRYGTVQVWMQHPYSVELSGTTIAGPARSYPFTVTVRDTSGEPVENVLVSANDSPEVPTNALGEAVHELTFPTLGHHDVDVTIRVPVSNLESQEFRKYYPYRVEVPTPESVEIAGPKIVKDFGGNPFTATVRGSTVRGPANQPLEGFRVWFVTVAGRLSDVTDLAGEARFSQPNFSAPGEYDVDAEVEASSLKRNFPRRIEIPSVSLLGLREGRWGSAHSFAVIANDSLSQAVEGIQIRLTSDAFVESVLRTETGGSAVFSQPLWEVGTWDVHVAVPGYSETFPNYLTVLEAISYTTEAPSAEVNRRAAAYTDATSRYLILENARQAFPSVEGQTSSIQTNLIWAPGDTVVPDLGITVIRVKFLNGDSEVQKTVKKAARKWEEKANIRFIFTDSGPADVRVGFDVDGKKGCFVDEIGIGEYLKVITNFSDVLDYAAAAANGLTDLLYGVQFFNTPHTESVTTLPHRRSELTMHLDIPGCQTEGTAIHELGHVLGFHHPQVSPKFPFRWVDRDEIYAYYEEKEGWDKDHVDHNVLDPVPMPDSAKYDPDSIMSYYLPPGWIEAPPGASEELQELAKKGIPSTNALSDLDREAVGNVYGEAKPYFYVINGSISIDGKDDELPLPADVLRGLESHEYLRTTRDITIYVSPQEETYLESPLASFGWGSELRTEVDIGARGETAAGLEMSLELRLYDGATEFPVFFFGDDLDGTTRDQFTLPLDNQQHSFSYRVENTDPKESFKVTILGVEFDAGGDYANITLNLKATRVNNQGMIPAPVNPIVSRSAADINADGQVNVADLALVSNYLGQSAPATPPVDINGDGTVTASDLMHVSQHLGTSTMPTAPVRLVVPAGITFETIRGWLNLARIEDDGSLVFRKGIANLERLLTLIIPEKTVLFSNFPNPFNPETWIPYQLAEPAEVTLSIYSVDGKLVRTLALGHQAAGVYRSSSRAAYWDGRNELGERVASGVYFYTLTAGDFSATGKMLVRK